MRITQHQADTIKRLVKRTFGVRANVYLFGSRVNDDARGGDIDLYVERTAGELDSRSGFQEKLRLASLLQRELGEQKFDIIVAQNPRRAIEVEARTKGVRL